ncbi:hypothetical protein BFP97_18510 [Roseivirga sp. 4D4]|uniref:serine hydrolase domain-containing protein n=1 Tax=Roseivirga sp. 4D4 TaxID=1889784 RepID=UPI0008533F1C|nr:serine hydrolase domain-containing protein [Roseivirga sp. 4D4]OEK03392.1 hypothetical protein BFP97_18510 [Roseivirga sp. 4D4]
MKTYLIGICGFFLVFQSFGQRFEPDTASMPDFIDSLFEQGIADRLVPGGIVGIIQGGKLVHGRAYGLADISTTKPVDFENTRFQLGSVGKLLTTIAVLKEVEAKRLDLHRSVNDYLSEFQLTGPGNDNVTLHHLLTHTAGFNERIIGYGTSSIETIEPLTEHLKRRIPSLYTAPGSEISYSNYGFGLAGHLVELSSGQEFKHYIQKEVLDVLNLNSATYEIAESTDGSFAAGHQTGNIHKKVRSFPRHVVPAGSISATGKDLVKLVRSLLAEDERLLNKESYQLLKQEQFSANPLLKGHGYGTEIQSFNGHFGVGKAGNIPGFLAYLVLFPQYDFGIFVAVNTETDNFLESFTKAFKDRFFPALSKDFEPTITLPDLSPFAGDFRANRYNRNTIEDLFGLILGSITVYNDSDSLLRLFQNGRWQYYQPIDKFTFQNTTQPDLYLVYEEVNGSIQKLHRNIEVGGFRIPLTLEKVPWYRTVHFINEYAAIFPLFNLSFLLFPFGWLVVWLVRRSKPQFMRGKLLNLSTRLTFLTFTLLTLINAIMFIKLLRIGEDLIFGVPNQILTLQLGSFLFPVILLIMTYRLFKCWKAYEGTIGSRIYLSIYLFSAGVYVTILHQWHFIGINF